MQVWMVIGGHEMVIGGFDYEGENSDSEDCRIFSSLEKAEEWKRKLEAEEFHYDYVFVHERELL